MQRYTDKVISIATGLPTVGARVTVNIAGTPVLAQLFATNNEAGPKLTNPFAASNGSFSFYTPNGRYDIFVAVNGRTASILDVEVLDLFELLNRLEAVENGDPTFMGSLRSDLLQAQGASRVNYGPGSVAAKLDEIVSTAEFLAVPNAVTQLNDRIAGGKGMTFNAPMSVGLAVNIRAAAGPITGGPGGRLTPIGQSEALICGALYAEIQAGFATLLSELAKGQSIVRVANANQYAPGQDVLVIGGLSANSTGANFIPTAKQFFTVAKVIDATSLQMEEASDYTFPVDENSRMSKASMPVLANGTVDGMVVSSAEEFDAPYAAGFQMIRTFTFKNMKVSGWRAVGAVTFSDMVVFENCLFSGFNGFSVARGARKITARDCAYSSRARSAEGVGIFLEETMESVLIDNMRLRGGALRITSSSDTDIRKEVVVRALDLEFDGKRLGGGTKPAVEVTCQNTPDGFIKIQGSIRTPGGTLNNAGATIPKCAIYANSTKRLLLDDVRLSGLDADAYGIVVNGADVFGIEINRVRIVDGSGRGVCHPSVLTNLTVDPAACTVRDPQSLEVAFEIAVSGGVARGRKYVTWLPEQGYAQVRWQFDTMPTGSYQFLNASKSNGAHLYDLSVHRSGVGASVAYEATVSQDFGTAPTVHTEADVLNAGQIVLTAPDATTTRATYVNQGGSETDNVVVELLYRFSKEDPTTSINLL